MLFKLAVNSIVMSLVKILRQGLNGLFELFALQKRVVKARLAPKI